MFRRHAAATTGALLLALSCALAPAPAAAESFTASSLIIPMDTTYQDSGMFEAYGLVYDLVANGVAHASEFATGGPS